MKAIQFSFAISLFVFSLAFAQEEKITATLVSKIKIDATTFVNTDPFGYHYYIKNNVFYKQNDSELFQYKNLSRGKITKVDIQNPLKIVLFYEGFNTVVTLDNQLNETQVISFSKNNTTIMASAVGLASQNRLWVFNSLTMHLELYDFLRMTHTPLAQPFREPIIDYDTTFNTFYWIDSTKSFYSCDIFGKITRLGQIPAYEKVQFNNEKGVFYQIENQIFYYDVKAEKSTLIEIEEKTFESFRFKDQFLIIFTDNKISTYKISLP